MKIWQLKILGIIALAGSLVVQFFPKYAHVGAFVASLATGSGLILARPNNVTSEQVGLTPVPRVPVAPPTPDPPVPTVTTL